MGASCIFLGDELSAAGFRLAGAEARVPPPGGADGCLQQALKDADVVLIGCGCARELAPSALEAALALLSPQVMVVPDWYGAQIAADPAAKARRVLGLET
jgi:hypothetical protein